MNENLDLTKILEGCPEGTKFYSTIYGAWHDDLSSFQWGLGILPNKQKHTVVTRMPCLPLLFANNIRILYTVIYFYYDGHNR